MYRDQQQSRNRNNSASIRKVEQAVSEIMSQANNTIIKKVAQEKKQATMKSSMNSIPKPASKVQVKETVKEPQEQIQQQITAQRFEPELNPLNMSKVSTISEISQFTSQNEKSLQLKIKEKQRELVMLKEKIQDLEHKNQQLQTENLKFKELIESKINSDQTPYNEKRNLILTQTLINQKILLAQLTRAMKQTRVIQVELEYQLSNIKNQAENYLSQIEESSKIHQTINSFTNFIEKSQQKLQYVLSQENFKQNENFPDKKKNINESNQNLIKAESCIAQIINTLQEDKQVQFQQTKLYETLSTLGIYLLQEYSANKTPQINLIDCKNLLSSHITRIQNKFITLFPRFNNLRETVVKNIQNDKIYYYLQSKESQIKELQHLINVGPNVPGFSVYFLLKNINIMRCLLIHTLTCIHTFSLNPSLKVLQNEFLPFVADCLGVLHQYQNKPAMGQQVLWGLFLGKSDILHDQIDEIMSELNQIKKQYQGLWNQVLDDEFFK